MSFRQLRIALATSPALLFLSAVPMDAQSGPYQYHAVTPCRLLDTRENPGPTGQNNGNPLPNPGPHQFRVQGWCGVPVGAKAISMNITAISPNRAGILKIYPVGQQPPDVSTINFNINELALANGAIMPLATVAGPSSKDLEIQNGMPTGPGGLMHLALDITGYFQ